MAHTIPEAARVASRGPFALAGVLIGAALVVVSGLFIAPPANCGPTLLGLSGSDITFFCGNLPATAASGIKDMHTISLLVVGVIAIVGGLLGAWLGKEREH